MKFKNALTQSIVQWDRGPDAERLAVEVDRFLMSRSDSAAALDAAKAISAMIADDAWQGQPRTAESTWLMVCDRLEDVREYQLILNTVSSVIRRTDDRDVFRNVNIVALMGLGRHREAAREVDELQRLIPTTLTTPTGALEIHHDPRSIVSHRSYPSPLLACEWWRIAIHRFRLGDPDSCQVALRNMNHFVDGWTSLRDRGDVLMKEKLTMECNLLTCGCLALAGHPVGAPSELRSWLSTLCRDAIAKSPFISDNPVTSDRVYLMGLLFENAGRRPEAAGLYEMLIGREEGHLLYDVYLRHARDYLAQNR